jgi:hypothetical protein
VSPVKYKLGILSQETAFFLVTAVKVANLTFLGGCFPQIAKLTVHVWFLFYIFAKLSKTFL